MVVIRIDIRGLFSCLVMIRCKTPNIELSSSDVPIEYLGKLVEKNDAKSDREASKETTT